MWKASGVLITLHHSPLRQGLSLKLQLVFFSAGLEATSSSCSVFSTHPSTGLKVRVLGFKLGPRGFAVTAPNQLISLSTPRLTFLAVSYYCACVSVDTCTEVREKFPRLTFHLPPQVLRLPQVTRFLQLLPAEPPHQPSAHL